MLIGSAVQMLPWSNPGITTVLLIFLLLFSFHSDCEVYSKNHAAPFSKVITFHKKEPFDLQAFYSTSQDLPYPDTAIGGTCHGLLQMQDFLSYKKIVLNLIFDPKNTNSRTQTIARHSALIGQFSIDSTTNDVSELI